MKTRTILSGWCFSMRFTSWKCAVVAFGLLGVAGSAWAIDLTPNDPKISYSDYAHMTVDSSKARFDRIISDSNKLTFDNPGARVRFRTDATSATATVDYSSLHTYPTRYSVGVILVDGVQTGTFTPSPSRGLVSVPVLTQGSAAYHDVELVMPYWDSVDFTKLTVNGDAHFATVPARPSTRYVAYGDSITQGASVSNATKTYAAQVGQAKGWEVVNMGIGGATLNGGDGAVIGGLGADIITVLMGYNDAYGHKTAATYKADMTTFVSNVRSQEANVPIYLVSPLYTTTAALAPLLTSYRQELQNLVATAGDPNLHFVDGLALGINSTNASAYLVDGIHLNDGGAALVAGSLAGMLTVPEPGALALLASGFVVMAAYARWRQPNVHR